MPQSKELPWAAAARGNSTHWSGQGVGWRWPDVQAPKDTSPPEPVLYSVGGGVRWGVKPFTSQRLGDHGASSSQHAAHKSSRRGALTNSDLLTSGDTPRLRLATLQLLLHPHRRVWRNRAIPSVAAWTVHRSTMRPLAEIQLQSPQSCVVVDGRPRIAAAITAAKIQFVSSMKPIRQAARIENSV